MAKLMMDLFEKKLMSNLEIDNVDEAEQKIGLLSDEKKIDLLDALVDVTMSYDSDPTSGPFKINPGGGPESLEREIEKIPQLVEEYATAENYRNPSAA